MKPRIHRYPLLTACVVAAACGSSSKESADGAGGAAAAAKAAKPSSADANAAEPKAEEAKGAAADVAEVKKADVVADPDPSAASSKYPWLDGPDDPDLAIVVTQAGIVAMDAAGKVRGTLSTENPAWCLVDPRAEVLWMLVANSEPEDEAALGPLSVIDLRGDADAITILPKAPSVVSIEYGDETLGGEDPIDYEDGLAVHMTDPPRVEATVGCDGDRGWYCYEEEDWDVGKAKRLARGNKAIAAQPFAGAALAPFVARSKGRKAISADPGRAPAPKKVAISSAACVESPEDCGAASVLAGSRFWTVIVSNDRGDFYYEETQLYDPKAGEFFDPSTPALRSKKPLSEDRDVSFEPAWISPSGELGLSFDMLLKMDGSSVIASDLDGSCGFLGGGWGR